MLTDQGGELSYIREGFLFYAQIQDFLPVVILFRCLGPRGVRVEALPTQAKIYRPTMDHSIRVSYMFRGRLWMYFGRQ